MERYYHYTNQKNIEKILREGLKPGNQIGVQTQYNGRMCNNNYIYLARNFSVFGGELFPNILKQKDFVFLSVDIPAEHPIERDLDVSLMITGQGIFASLEFFKIMNMLGTTDITGADAFLDEEGKKLHDTLLKEVENGNEKAKGGLIYLFATSEEVVKGLFSKVPVESWDNVFGFYRTAKPIPCNRQYKLERHIL